MRFGKQREHTWFAVGTALIVFFALGTTRLLAQTEQPKGFSLFEEFRASSDNRYGQTFLLDTNMGYNFNRHFGMDVGIPLYEVHDKLVPGTTYYQKFVGDPYWDMHLTFDSHILDYATYVTLAVPTVETGSFNANKLGADWFNHFDKRISRFTPYVNLGIANGVLDTHLLNQPYRLFQSYRTVGFIFDGEGGLLFRLANAAKIGASYYQFVPSGNEQTYATNFFLQPIGSLTVAQITHDHGVTAFLKLSPTRFLFIEPGFVHSLELKNNALTLNVGLDLRELVAPRSGGSSHY